MVKQKLFHVLVHCKHILDQGRLTWRHNSVLNHITGCLKSALVEKSTVIQLYSCTVTWMDYRPWVGGRSWLTSWCRHRDWTLSSLIGRCMVALVELTCPWDTDAKRAKEHNTARYADLKTALSNEGWDCSLCLTKVGARGHTNKSVKGCLRSLFRAWVPKGQRLGIGQMIKDVSRISLVSSFAIF
jgi:hypothetical protein